MAGGGVCLDIGEAAKGCQEAVIARYGNDLPKHQLQKIVRACMRRGRQFIV